MQGLDHFDDGESHHTVFRDVIFLALAGFMAMVIILLPHINPPPTVAKALDITSPGNVIVEIVWDPSYDTDVDLWVKAPGDVPVGYSNKGGMIFNLLRDDIGEQNDVSGINYESSFSRGIPPGEYIINLHLYRDMSGSKPIKVKVIVSLKENPDATTTRILLAEVELVNLGQELTVFRFTIDKNRKLVTSSVNNRPAKLRSGRT